MSSMNKLRLVITLFYIVVFWGLATYDEPLDTGAQEMFSSTTDEVIEPGNGWVAFMGFMAPSQEGMYDYGKQRIAAGLDDRGSFNDDCKDQCELEFKADPCEMKIPGKDVFLPYAASHAREIAMLVLDNQELLDRYRQLRLFPHYSEPIHYGFTMPIPRYSPLRSSQKAFLLQQAVRVNKGDVTGALEEVRRDADYWRFVSRESATLISKLISISFLYNNLRFAAEIGESFVLNEQQWELLSGILRPFEGEEASMAKPMRGEAVYMLNGIRISDEDEMSNQRFLDRLFYKQNATMNRLYTHSLHQIELAEMSPGQYSRFLQSETETCEESRQIGFPVLFNAVGEILANISRIQSYYGYVERAHNLEGLRRLALLKVLAKREGVTHDGMQRFLDVHVDDLGNPYSGEAMEWDAEKNEILFNVVDGDRPVKIVLRRFSNDSV